MFALISSQNVFELVERITCSTLCALALLMYFIAYKRVSAHQSQILKDTDRWYLVISAIHLLFQLTYYFLIGSTFFLYYAFIILYIELLCLNDTFTPHLENISNRIKSIIENIAKYGIPALMIFGVVLVLQIDSDNQCGQNSLPVNLSLYSALTLLTTVELVYIAWKKSSKLNRLSEERSYNMEIELGEEIQIK